MRKRILNTITFMFVVTLFVSCRDEKQKKEETAVTNESIQKIDSIERNIETTKQDLDAKAEAAEAALGALDDL
jgi:hypothetical protein